MAILQLFKGNIAANLAIQLKLDTALFQQLCASFDNFLFQLEARNAIDQQAAHPVIAIIDHHLIAFAAQDIGRSQTRRPCPNNTDRLIALGHNLNRLYPAFFKGGFGNIFFHRTDSDRLKTLFDNAIAFA